MAENATPCSPDYVERVKKILGPVGKDVTAEDAHEALLAHHEAEVDHNLSRSTELEEAQARIIDLESALASKDDECKTLTADLSRGTMPNLTDREIVLSARVIKADFDKAVLSGGITPAVRKELDTLLLPGGRPDAIALSVSSGGVDLFASKLATILASNKPVDLSQKTGIQLLARTIPNDDLHPADPDGPLPFADMAKDYNSKIGS